MGFVSLCHSFSRKLVPLLPVRIHFFFPKASITVFLSVVLGALLMEWSFPLMVFSFCEWCSASVMADLRYTSARCWFTCCMQSCVSWDGVDCLANLGVWHEQVHPPAWLSSQQLELVCNKPSVLALALVLSFNLWKVRSREECYFRDSIWRMCQPDPPILLPKVIPCVAFSPIFNSTSLEQGIQCLYSTATIMLCSISLSSTLEIHFLHCSHEELFKI